MHKKILSIDIGITNLGISHGLYDVNYNLVDINHIDLINIAEYTHSRVDESSCTLYHSKNVFDYCVHIVQENADLFNDADVVLIERQPPGGLVHVEQILFGLCRDKCVLIHPTSVHNFLNFQGLDYDQRKVASYISAQETIKKCSLNAAVLLDRLTEFTRQHDVADAVGQTVFWLHKQQAEQQATQQATQQQQMLELENRLNSARLGQRKQEELDSGQEMNVFFEAFRYKGK